MSHSGKGITEVTRNAGFVPILYYKLLSSSAPVRSYGMGFLWTEVFVEFSGYWVVCWFGK